MSIYILMRILESTPYRYDKGIRILSFGKLGNVYDRLISHIKKDQKVLDIGSGTGSLAIKAAQKDAIVTGIDVNPQMLDIAQKKAEKLKTYKNLEFREMGVAELGSFESQTFDVVMSGLCFSELSKDELIFTLKNVYRILKKDGLLLVADEIEPSNFLLKVLNWLLRAPLKIITYILTQTGTHAVKNLPEQVKAAGFKIDTIRKNKMGNFIEMIAIKNDGKSE